MKNSNENALMQEMSMGEMENVNGGLPTLAAVFIWGFSSGAALGIAILPNILEKRENNE